MQTPESFRKLMSVLTELPGVGRRSAERMAYALVKDRGRLLADLMAATRDATQTLCLCSRCGGVTAREVDPCGVCRDPRRDDHLLCVVEEPGDIGLIERAGGFPGRFFVLMGKLSPMHGEGVQNTRIEALLERVLKESVQEVVLALNTDVESDATGSYIRDMLAPRGIRVTRLARGIPAGSGLSYSDTSTLAHAIQNRKQLD